MPSASASLVPAQTCPCSGGGHHLRCLPWRRYLHGGVVVVIMVHLNWGPSSSSNTRSLCAEPNNRHIYINKTPRLGMGGAQVADILVQAKPGTGGPKSWPMAMPWRRVRQLIRPGTVVMAARQTVVASKE
jgi:hypothetical protein